MHWLRTVAHGDLEMQELMRDTGRHLVYTVAALYLVGHVIGTVGYPQIFSPSLWIISLWMLILISLTLHLLPRHYLLAQVLWLGGLATAVLLGYFLYHSPQIFLLWLALPFIAVSTLGVPVAILALLCLLLAAGALVRYAALPASYVTWIFLGGSAMTTLGWSVSSRLMAALDAASYHYHETQCLLEETRTHQAEISRMLKDREQVNYQLERMNEMLAFARVQAEEARENRNRFMLAVSHELRSPLNFIIGFSDLMVNAPQTYAPLEQWPPGLYEDVQEIYVSSKHLMRLINDILDMGKIEAGQMSLYRERTRLEQVIEDVRAMLAPAFAQKGIELRIEIPPDLPSAFIDTTRIRQVLLNLLNNGLRFTEKGYVALRIEKQEETLCISVCDTGPGIAPQDLPKVFQEFRQVGEENWRRRAGSGLGLYISRQFVELHGGTMGVESTVGEGTRFYFTIPLYPERPEATLISTGPLPHRLYPTILFLSPQSDDAPLLQRGLDGYRLETVHHVEEALQKIRETFPRAVLITADFETLPPEQLPYDLPMLRVALPHSFSQSYQVYAHLVKPVGREKLLQTLHSLGKSQARLLVIDDDPTMVRFVQQACRTYGQEEYTLLSAFSAAQADEILSRESVDAILLDLELPDVHGLEWLRRFRSRPSMKNLPVIVVSAQDLPEGGTIPDQPALALYLQRPLQPTELGILMKTILEEIPPQYPGT